MSHTVGLDGVGKALEMLSNYQEMEPEWPPLDSEAWHWWVPQRQLERFAFTRNPEADAWWQNW